MMQRLPLWSQTFEELNKVTVPSSETVSRFEDEFSDCKVFAANLESRLGDARLKLRDVDRQIESIRLAGAVPTEEVLDRARDRRQKGWGLVKKAWLKGENVDEESRAYDPQRDLAEAYEASVGQTDETADRLLREAARVAEYAALTVQKENLEEEIIKLRKGMKIGLFWKAFSIRFMIPRFWIIRY